MKAFVVFAGGGVKGAALAGCLKALEEFEIDIAGFGGTSAGAVVACLAAAGYSGDDLRQLMKQEIRFPKLLDDGGKALTRLRKSVQRLSDRSGPLQIARLCCGQGRLLRRVSQRLGIYSGMELQRAIDGLIARRLPSGGPVAESLSFAQLPESFRPLSVVACDIVSRGAFVFSRETTPGVAVATAVRASAGYPLVFEPIALNGGLLVDGGLSSNLPVFLFGPQANPSLPIVAFDLIAAEESSLSRNPSLSDFFGLLFGSAIQSSDRLLRDAYASVHYVPIHLGRTMHALDFDASAEIADELWKEGHRQALSYFARELQKWKQPSSIVGQLQALYGRPQLLVQVLRDLVREVELETHARGVRAHIMVPTIHETRIVAYQYGMDEHPDVDLELNFAAGCSGRVFTQGQPTFADLEDVVPSDWGMTPEQQARIPPDRKSMACVPIFAHRPRASATRHPKARVIATLSIDSATPLGETGWLVETDERLAVAPGLIDALESRAEVCSRVFFAEAR